MKRKSMMLLFLGACMHLAAQNLKLQVNGVPVEMVKVEGGTFTMGDQTQQIKDALPLHKVTLKGYYVGRTEVTQQLWRAVMGSNNSKFKGQYKDGRKNGPAISEDKDGKRFLYDEPSFVKKF